MRRTIQQATHAGVMVPAQAKGMTSRSHRRQRSICEAKAAADAAEVATWASLLEEEMEARPEREPEVEYEAGATTSRSWKTTPTTTSRLLII